MVRKVSYATIGINCRCYCRKAIIDPIGEPAAPLAAYKENAFFGGFIQGYLTMDAISALVFGIVVVQVIRSKGIKESSQIAK